MILRMQEEATLLKNVTSGGAATKVIAVGIGGNITESKLRGIASAPHNRTVIHVDDFDSLSSLVDQLRDDTCRGKYCFVL